MSLDQLIKSCENQLHLGFSCGERSGLKWLNNACGELSNLCYHLRELLLSKVDDCALIEMCFLFTSQIVICIKFLENVLRVEKRDDIALTPTREFFLDRVLWCLSRLKAVCVSPSSVISKESNFVYYMGISLDMITPLGFLAEQANSSDIETQRADALNGSTRIRTVIDELIGQALAFVNVATPDDKKPLTAMCQKVLKDCIEFIESGVTEK